MRKLSSFRSNVAVVLLCVFISSLISCGGGAGSGNDPDLSTSEVPEQYNDIVAYANDESEVLGMAAKDFAEKLNAFNAFDPSKASAADVMTPLNELQGAAANFYSHFDYYNKLMTAYGTKLAESGKDAKAVEIFKQSVDPLVMKDIADLINNGKTEAEAIQEMINKGEDPDEVNNAINQYKIKYTKQTFNLGVTTMVGAGAGVIAGLAAATAGASVLVVTGVGIGAGVLAGAIWSWCTAEPTPSKADATDSTCAIAAVEGEVVKLPDGTNGMAITLPQGGPGEFCFHTTGKAPLCVKTTIDKAGNTIILGCLAGEDDASADALKCANTSTIKVGITTKGISCQQDVTSVTASAAVGGGATVTVNTSLPTKGCKISYSLVGTDVPVPYTQSGTLTTSDSGSASFFVPAGASGVHDTVSITATESGVSTEIGYTF